MPGGLFSYEKEKEPISSSCLPDAGAWNDKEVS